MEISVEFGKVTIDGVEYDRDVVITSDGKILERPKEISEPKKEKYGHTPLSIEEFKKILENVGSGDVLFIGTGIEGKLPVEPEVIEEAKKKFKLVIMDRTPFIIGLFDKVKDKKWIAILHVTC